MVPLTPGIELDLARPDREVLDHDHLRPRQLLGRHDLARALGAGGERRHRTHRRQAGYGPPIDVHPCCPRCGPDMDARLSWPPGPLLKVKKRVLKPWHWLPPRPGLRSSELKK